jgi:hypothetical protein
MNRGGDVLVMAVSSRLHTGADRWTRTTTNFLPVLQSYFMRIPLAHSLSVSHIYVVLN